MMTLKQVDGYVNAPKRDVARLAATARSALLKISALEESERRLQEQVATLEADRPPIVVVLHRDGYVEVKAAEWQNVRVVHRPDLGREGEDEADEWVLGRLPFGHREVAEMGKVIAVGNSSGCMTKWQFRCLREDMDRLAALKEMDAVVAKQVEETSEAGTESQG